MCASVGGGVRPHETEPFTKAVIRVVPAMVSSLRVVAGLQQLLSFPENNEVSLLLSHFCQAYLHMHKVLLVQQDRH